MARLRSNTKISLSMLIDVTRTPTRARPTSHLGGLNLPCRSATKIHLRVLLRADPTLVITCVMYIVYKYMPVITAQVITAR